MSGSDAAAGVGQVTFGGAAERCSVVAGGEHKASLVVSHKEATDFDSTGADIFDGVATPEGHSEFLGGGKEFSLRFSRSEEVNAAFVFGLMPAVA